MNTPLVSGTFKQNVIEISCGEPFQFNRIGDLPLRPRMIDVT
jgi:hypothetical protein